MILSGSRQSQYQVKLYDLRVAIEPTWEVSTLEDPKDGVMASGTKQARAFRVISSHKATQIVGLYG